MFGLVRIICLILRLGSQKSYGRVVTVAVLLKMGKYYVDTYPPS